MWNKNIHPVVYINNSSFYSKNKINTFHNIFYILSYWSFTPETWSFIKTYWLKDWKAESNYWTWFFSQYKWFRAVTSGLFSFLWHNIRKISIGNWLPFINLQMDTAHVYQTECFQNKTAWTQTKSANEMYAYWHNLNTNNQS